ncbi:hypothetical protein C1884_09390 [Pseudomonas sp. GW460-R15]|nr:hypothetical protein C1887_11745 [Pseudomonas sp. GW456-R21]POA68551.1 hypothetical protein C1884_09390 [Pseudomonas sp. GW460-R15]
MVYQIISCMNAITINCDCPLDLTANRSETLILLEALLTYVHLDQASAITSFWLTKGHPAYPVF